ncbi:hypothetical protein DH86_00001177 [Scytalidium sp. 3C]|nr:hypothetical protein DH86_00001177 [Scytalidium sp. 3C]
MLRSTRHQRVCSECVKTISRSAPIPQRLYATAAAAKAPASKAAPPPSSPLDIPASERNGAAAKELGGYQAYGKMGWNDEILVGDERSQPGYVVQKLLEDARVRTAEGKDGSVSVIDADASAEGEGLDRVENRLTEADIKKDVRRLDRKLAETLYLVVQKEKGGWGFPTSDLIGRENLYQAAERILVQSAGVNMNTWIVGHAPIGHHVIKPYINPETKAIERVGDKIFFMKGRIMAGQANLKGNLFGFNDFKWLTKKELEEVVSPKYFSSIRNMLADR